MSHAIIVGENGLQRWLEGEVRVGYVEWKACHNVEDSLEYADGMYFPNIRCTHNSIHHVLQMFLIITKRVTVNQFSIFVDVLFDNLLPIRISFH